MEARYGCSAMNSKVEGTSTVTVDRVKGTEVAGLEDECQSNITMATSRVDTSLQRVCRMMVYREA